MKRLSRRAWLRGAALGAGLSPFVRTLGRALAQEPGTVLERFVAIYMPHGVARELWRPRAGFDIAYENCSLTPLDGLRQELLVLEGLDLTAGIKGGSAGHTGSRALLTGSALEGRNASIDQFLAEEQGLGALTPVASLVLGVGNAAADIGACISYGAGGTPLPKIIDPRDTFEQAFGRWISGSDPDALARTALERRRGQSSLDVLRADLAGLRARASATERVELDRHLSALRAIEKRLATFELACAVPAAPDAGSFPDIEAFLAAPYFDAISDLQIDLLTQALVCGVTRFASLYLADLSYTGLVPELPADVHADVAHRYAAASDDGTDPGVPETWLPLARQNRYSCTKVERLARRLFDANLLGDTLVVGVSDMGDPARHSSRNVPVLVLGGADAGVRLGRYLDVRTGGAGIPHNRLLVSICRAFGVDIESYGEAASEIVTGTLDGFV